MSRFLNLNGIKNPYHVRNLREYHDSSEKY